MDTAHTGLSHHILSNVNAGSFLAVLSATVQGRGRVGLVIHTTTTKEAFETARDQPGDLHPLHFLGGLGLEPHADICQFHGRNCYGRWLGTLEGSDNPGDFMGRAEGLRERFERFARALPDLYALRCQDARILEGLNLQTIGPAAFATPSVVTLDLGAVPAWVERLKFPRLRELESQDDAMKREIADLRSFLPLLYEQGEPLEHAVVATLRFLGLTAERTTPGATVDVLARRPSGGGALGVEVTGTNGPINKQSNKLTQIVTFEQMKQDEDKGFLLANTHRNLPVDDRATKEDFTPPALAFLDHFPILLMTGWDLYRLLGDVVAVRREKAETVELLYRTSGRFMYPEPMAEVMSS